MVIARKKKEVVETVEPEIVSIAPVEPSEKVIALKQKQAQLKATEKDLEEFLPQVMEARQKLALKILDVLMSEDQATVDSLDKWIATHLKDANSALSTLNAIAGTIVKPQQLQSGGRKRIRLMFGKDQGVEITE